MPSQVIQIIVVVGDPLEWVIAKIFPFLIWNDSVLLLVSTIWRHILKYQETVTTDKEIIGQRISIENVSFVVFESTRPSQGCQFDFFDAKFDNFC